MRKVIVHYHLFKNAGTSVDHLLRASFDESWYKLDDETPIGPDRLRQFFVDHPDARALSSHNARLPLPEATGMRFFPILLLRHPLDRIRSVYDFERRQEADTFGASLAKRTSLRGYIETRWSLPRDMSVRNFQASRLALPGGEAACDDEALWSRTVNMFAALPFVGLVEQFSLSVCLLRQLLAPHFPDLVFHPVQLNITQSSDEDLKQRLARMKSALGDDFYARLVAENKVDLALYQLASNRVQALSLSGATEA